MSVKSLKPLSRATRVRALHDRRSHSVTRQLEELLFRDAQVLSEGCCRQGQGGERTYYGSTMISVNLADFPAGIQLDLRGIDEETLESAVSGSVRIRLRAMRLARAEVVRRAPNVVLGTAQVETQIRLERMTLHIDVDLEVPILGAGDQRNEGG